VYRYQVGIVVRIVWKVVVMNYSKYVLTNFSALGGVFSW
jgi:hypothetical protein